MRSLWTLLSKFWSRGEPTAPVEQEPPLPGDRTAIYTRHEMRDMTDEPWTPPQWLDGRRRGQRR